MRIKLITKMMRELLDLLLDCYLSIIFDVEFDDMSDLWDFDQSLKDLELVEVMDHYEKSDKYVPLVEDISLDDEFLCDAVETIEHE